VVFELFRVHNVAPLHPAKRFNSRSCRGDASVVLEQTRAFIGPFVRIGAIERGF
jgi:hypothetical protein